MTRLYLVWYCSAILSTIATWKYSGKLERSSLKILLRTGVLALGFTTVPLGFDGEGALFPMGLYYFAQSNWLEASFGASVVIGTVWVILFVLSITLVKLFKIIRKDQ